MKKLTPKNALGFAAKKVAPIPDASPAQAEEKLRGKPKGWAKRQTLTSRVGKAAKNLNYF